METTARERFAKGQRVRFTESAPFREPRKKAGVVVGFGRDGRTVRVKRDGLKEVVSFHMDFLEPESGTEAP